MEPIKESLLGLYPVCFPRWLLSRFPGRTFRTTTSQESEEEGEDTQRYAAAEVSHSVNVRGIVQLRQPLILSGFTVCNSISGTYSTVYINEYK